MHNNVFIVISSKKIKIATTFKCDLLNESGLSDSLLDPCLVYLQQ